MTLTDDEVLDLIEGYEEWRRERSTSDPDLSPRAYLNERAADARRRQLDQLRADVRSAGMALDDLMSYDFIPKELVAAQVEALQRATLAAA